jgi:DNA-binding GntR family transcriptional regulator
MGAAPLQALREQVYGTSLYAMFSGALPPDLRLRDGELVAEPRASRTPVREARQRMEDEGLVRRAGVSNSGDTAARG